MPGWGKDENFIVQLWPPATLVSLESMHWRTKSHYVFVPMISEGALRLSYKNLMKQEIKTISMTAQVLNTLYTHVTFYPFKSFVLFP